MREQNNIKEKERTDRTWEDSQLSKVVNTQYTCFSSLKMVIVIRIKEKINEKESKNTATIHIAIRHFDRAKCLFNCNDDNLLSQVECNSTSILFLFQLLALNQKVPHQ